MDVALRRTALDRRALLVLLVYAALATLLVVAAAALLEGTPLLVALIVLVLMWLLWSGLYVLGWTRMRAIDSPLGLNGSGLVSRSQFGTLSVPWEAVESARLERHWAGTRLRVRLVPQADPRAEGIVADRLPPSALRMVRAEGIRITLSLLDIDEEELRRAFVVQSGGRQQLS